MVAVVVVAVVGVVAVVAAAAVVDTWKSIWTNASMPACRSSAAPRVLLGRVRRRPLQDRDPITNDSTSSSSEQ